jgi:hypothetical protein
MLLLAVTFTTAIDPTEILDGVITVERPEELTAERETAPAKPF